MSWTRLSFFYLISYLGIGGIGLVAAPEFSIRLLGSTGTYPTELWRLIGGFMIALSLVVIGIFRHRVEVLYPTTLMVRIVLLATILWTFFDLRDPLFLSLAGIVALGMILTTLGILADKKTGRT